MLQDAVMCSVAMCRWHVLRHVLDVGGHPVLVLTGSKRLVEKLKPACSPGPLEPTQLTHAHGTQCHVTLPLQATTVSDE